MPELVVSEARLGLLLYLAPFAVPERIGAGTLKAPWGVAADGAGGVLVADSGNHRIVHYPAVGGAAFDAFGSQGAGMGEFEAPRGVAFDADGGILVADTGNGRIVRMDDLGGSGWTTFGERGAPSATDPAAVGRFREPVGIVADASGSVWVTDASGGRLVRVASMDGDGWLAVVVRSPLAVAMDGPAEILVAELAGRRVTRRAASSGMVVAATPADLLAGPGAVSGRVVLDSASRRILTVDDGLARDAGADPVHLADHGLLQPVGMCLL